jgi:hypothetical protein
MRMRACTMLKERKKERRDKCGSVGAVRIDYRFYRGSVPHSQFTPASIGARPE